MDGEAGDVHLIGHHPGTAVAGDAPLLRALEHTGHEGLGVLDVVHDPHDDGEVEGLFWPVFFQTPLHELAASEHSRRFGVLARQLEHALGHVETDAQGSKLATVGISRHAVEALTDLVYLELPELGRQVRCGEPLGEVESVKAVSDLYSPVDGEIVSVHRDLPEHLERFPDLHDKFWKATKLAGDAKKSVDPAQGQQLLDAIDELSKIFWETKS